MADASDRIIALAEGALAAAENEKLSVAGHIARVYAAVDEGDLDSASDVLVEVDKLINEARSER